MPKSAALVKPVERLFPFVLRARILLIGRETLSRSKSRLHFVLITEDLSENSYAEVVSEFSHYPTVLRRYSTGDLEGFPLVSRTRKCSGLPSRAWLNRFMPNSSSTGLTRRARGQPDPGAKAPFLVTALNNNDVNLYGKSRNATPGTKTTVQTQKRRAPGRPPTPRPTGFASRTALTRSLHHRALSQLRAPGGS